jgi:predicted O-linked N-acetylglucosamine transferase (SPINDLY family)
MLPLLEHHDRVAFEIYAYSNVPVPDASTELHRANVEHFRDISHLDHDAAARLIDEDRIDVLVDLTMHMANSRLLTFARRPAPVQVSWLAYPGTTGVSAIDYRFTDPHIDPPGTPPSCSERTYILPDSFWCFHPMRPEAPTIEPGPLPARSSGYVTFGCLNSFAKVNDEVLGLWGRVLEAVPDSRLLMLAPRGNARHRVFEHLARAGVASERISFVDYQERRHYLQTFQRIDIALDTLPATGHTTSLDTWWMGVPVLSLIGRTIAGRAGLSYAANLGLREWCVGDVESYVAEARRFAADWDRLEQLRAELRSRLAGSPLMDAKRFAMNLETAYGHMWSEWYAGRSS